MEVNLRRRWLLLLVFAVVVSTVLYSVSISRVRVTVPPDVEAVSSQSVPVKNAGGDGRGVEAPQEQKGPLRVAEPARECPEQEQESRKKFRHRQRGRFTVLLNYVTPDWPEDENAALDDYPDFAAPSTSASITYTTHGEFPFLTNLPFLTTRWSAPVSMALYVPGTDFSVAIMSIGFVRKCNEDVRKWVSFHLVFEQDRFPVKERIPRPEDLASTRWKDLPECDDKPPWEDVVPYRETLRQKEIDVKMASAKPKPRPSPEPEGETPEGGETGSGKGRQADGAAARASIDDLTPPSVVYPINVCRNVARESATTEFVLASDVELYPSSNFVQSFMAMVESDPQRFRAEKIVYPMPIFEVKESASVPETKEVLLKMLSTGDAVPFHASVCPLCHRFPFADEWVKSGPGEGMSILGTATRTGQYSMWEPIYVGTNREPPYDERLSWEGKKDKMTQMFALCAMGYRFAILDGAFLVHSPGIKRYRRVLWRDALAVKQTTFIRKVIKPELVVLYGEPKNCTI